MSPPCLRLYLPYFFVLNGLFFMISSSFALCLIVQVALCTILSWYLMSDTSLFRFVLNDTTLNQIYPLLTLPCQSPYDQNMSCSTTEALYFGWIIWTQQRGFCPLFIQTQMPEDITSSLVKQLPASQRYMLQTTSRDESSNSSNNLAQRWKHHRIYYVCYRVFSSWQHS